MAVKLPLQRQGRKKAPFYHIVVADSRSPRDGRSLETIGSYNPRTIPATIELDRDRAFYWINTGAQPTDTVNAILRFKGVLHRKHLQRGVTKGVLTQEKADQLYAEWIEAKEAKINARREERVKEVVDMHKKIFGTVKVKPVVEAPVEEEAPAAEEAADETPAVDEAPAAETEAPTENPEA